MNFRKRKSEEWAREIIKCANEGRPLSGIWKLEADITEKAITKVKSRYASNPEMSLEAVGEYARTVAREMWAESIRSIQPKEVTCSEYDA